MRILTVKQPWAWAIIHGQKDVENRTKSLGPYRGPVAIHAGLVKPDHEAIVKVTVVAPPPQFQGSARHGVTSHDFGRFGSAYRIGAV